MQIDLDHLKQQKQDLVNIRDAMSWEGSLHASLNGIIHTMDSIQDGLEESDMVILTTANKQ